MAMAKPKTVACSVTQSPRIRIGRIDTASVQPLVVSHSKPKSMCYLCAGRQRPTIDDSPRMKAVSTSAMPKYISRTSV